MSSQSFAIFSGIAAYRQVRKSAAMALAFLAVVVIPGETLRGQTQAEAKNMNLVGSNDLQGRSAYQPTIEKQGDRYIAYIGHHGGKALNPLSGREEPNGTSILDVTDPARPKYLAHIPGEPADPHATENPAARRWRACARPAPRGPRKYYLLRSFGDSAHEIWDVTDPSKPSRVTVIVGRLHDTHKNWWECDTGIAYLVSGLPGWRTRRMMQIYDLSDPAHPVFIRNFGLPGQQPGATGPVPSDMHGAISTGPKGNRLYVAYGTTKNGVLQILDRKKLLTGPKEPTDANLRYPQIARVNLPPDVGAHTSFPILGVTLPEFADHKTGNVRDFVAVVGEALDNECQQPRQMVRFFDITTETIPVGVSTWTVPETSENFCAPAGVLGRTHPTRI